jgi:hypothetical protein
MGPEALRATRVVTPRLWALAADGKPLPPAAARDLFRALARARADFYVSPHDFGDDDAQADFTDEHAEDGAGVNEEGAKGGKGMLGGPRALFTRERLDARLVADAGLQRARLDRAYVALELVTAQGRAVVAAALEFLGNEALVHDFDGAQFGAHFLAAFEPFTRLLAHPGLVARAQALQLLPPRSRADYNDFTVLHRISTTRLSGEECEYIAATLPDLRYALGVFQGPY